MIMKVNTYGDKVKDLVQNRQRQDKHLRLVTVVEITKANCKVLWWMR